MGKKEINYVSKYYVSNYASGSVDDELKSLGTFIAKNAYGRVLDCGCGPVPQLYAIFMPRMEELYAIDLPQESIDFVKKKISTARNWYKGFLSYQKIVEEIYGQQAEGYILNQIDKLKDVQKADMSLKLPFPDNYFDTVVSFYSLGCLQNEQELISAITNIGNVLKPGGILLHVNTDGKNSNQELPAYTWRGLDQASDLIKKCLSKTGWQLVSEKEVELSKPSDQMYKYSRISMLKARKIKNQK